MLKINCILIIQNFSNIKPTNNRGKSKLMEPTVHYIPGNYFEKIIKSSFFNFSSRNARTA